MSLLRWLFGKERIQTEYEDLVSRAVSLSNSEKGEFLALVTDARNQFEDLYGWNLLEPVSIEDVGEIVNKISAIRDVAEGLRNPLARSALDVWYFTAQFDRSVEFKYLTTLLWVELERGIPFCEAAKDRLSARGTMLNIDRYEQRPDFLSRSTDS